MRVTLKASVDYRRELYLAAWPIHAQLEAHAEAASGRPEKLTKMLADFAAIREGK